MPLSLQKIVKLIESVYLVSAVIKVFIQIALLYLLAGLTTQTYCPVNFDFLTVIILISPLFQVFEYTSLRIIDQSTTYNFFYSLPLLFLILFLSYYLS